MVNGYDSKIKNRLFVRIKITASRRIWFKIPVKKLAESVRDVLLNRSGKMKRINKKICVWIRTIYANCCKIIVIPAESDSICNWWWRTCEKIGNQCMKIKQIN
jgi:hypothetical protein